MIPENELAVSNLNHSKLMNTSLQFMRRALVLVGHWVKHFRTLIRTGSWILLAVALLECRVYGFAHQWKINELYSNADGSVQFIEFTNASIANNESFLSGLDLTCSSALRTNTFTFPGNLPSGTAFKTFLVGTTNLASIPGGVTPNYFIPANFLLLGNGTASYDTIDVVTYANLPTNGVASLVRSGASMVFSANNSPKSFNSVSNSIVPVMIQLIQQSGTDFVLTFTTATGTNGTAGPNYALEFNSAITNTGWQTLANVGGDGTTKTVTNASPPDPQRFYRLRVP